MRSCWTVIFDFKLNRTLYAYSNKINPNRGKSKIQYIQTSDKTWIIIQKKKIFTEFKLRFEPKVFYSGKRISNKSVRNLWSNPVSQSHADSMSQFTSLWKNSKNVKYPTPYIWYCPKSKIHPTNFNVLKKKYLFNIIT